MEICKAPTLQLKAPNKYNIIHIMYIEIENVISNLIHIMYIETENIISNLIHIMYIETENIISNLTKTNT